MNETIKDLLTPADSRNKFIRAIDEMNLEKDILYIPAVENAFKSETDLTMFLILFDGILGKNHRLIMAFSGLTHSVPFIRHNPRFTENIDTVQVVNSKEAAARRLVTGGVKHPSGKWMILLYPWEYYCITDMFVELPLTKSEACDLTPPDLRGNFREFKGMMSDIDLYFRIGLQALKDRDLPPFISLEDYNDLIVRMTPDG